MCMEKVCKFQKENQYGGCVCLPLNCAGQRKRWNTFHLNLLWNSNYYESSDRIIKFFLSDAMKFISNRHWLPVVQWIFYSPTSPICDFFERNGNGFQNVVDWVLPFNYTSENGLKIGGQKCVKLRQFIPIIFKWMQPFWPEPIYSSINEKHLDRIWNVKTFPSNKKK